MLGRNKKQRAVQVSFVKTDKNAAPGDDKNIRPETVALISERAKEVAKFVAITGVAAYAAVVTIRTLSEIALKKTKSADNNEK
jgi:hypothetical protein